MVALLVAGADDHLLQVRETTVDVRGFLHGQAFSTSLFGTFTACEIDQRQARVNNLFGSFDRAAGLKVDGENSVGSARSFVDLVVGRGAGLLSLNEAVKSFFLALAVNHGKALEVNLALVVILNGNVGSSLLVGGLAGEHVEEKLVVDFDVGNLDRDLGVKTAADLREDLADSARDETTVFEVGGGAGHGERLSGAGLAVAHDGTVESVDDGGDGLGSAVVEEAFLGGVMH